MSDKAKFILFLVAVAVMTVWLARQDANEVPLCIAKAVAYNAQSGEDARADCLEAYDVRHHE